MRARFRFLKGTFYTSLPQYQIVLRNSRGEIYTRTDPSLISSFGPSTKIHLSDYHGLAAEERTFVRVTTDIRKVTCYICTGCFLMGYGRASFSQYWHGLRKTENQRAKRLRQILDCRSNAGTTLEKS